MNTIDRTQKFFALKELVSPQVLAAYHEQAWSFFDPRLLEVLLWIRTGIGRAMIVNDGVNLTQRGFRSNIDPIVRERTEKGRLYCSAHMRGQAVDFTVRGMTCDEVRRWIRDHAVSSPYPIRQEIPQAGKTMNWCHIDVATTLDRFSEFYE